jgi:hypothetical protein
MPCHAMHPIQDLFWKDFSYILQIDMHLLCAPMLAKFYSCKNWVLQIADAAVFNSRAAAPVSNLRLAMSVSTSDLEYLATCTASDVTKGNEECTWQESAAAVEDVVQGNKGQAMTQANPKFVMGKPMLAIDTLHKAGQPCVELQNYYINNYKSGQDIIVSYKDHHFLVGDGFFLISFSDLYDLFNLNALHVSLMPCFAL